MWLRVIVVIAFIIISVWQMERRINAMWVIKPSQVGLGISGQRQFVHWATLGRSSVYVPDQCNS